MSGLPFKWCEVPIMFWCAWSTFLNSVCTNAQQSQEGNLLHKDPFMHPHDALHLWDCFSFKYAAAIFILPDYTERHPGNCRKLQDKAVYVIESNSECIVLHRCAQVMVNQCQRLDFSFKLFQTLVDSNLVAFLWRLPRSVLNLFSVLPVQRGLCSFFSLFTRFATKSLMTFFFFHTSIDSVGSPILRVKNVVFFLLLFLLTSVFAFLQMNCFILYSEVS